ncbi:M64 family metallopeptidase [Kitasatospora sp. NPDC001664]
MAPGDTGHRVRRGAGRGLAVLLLLPVAGLPAALELTARSPYEVIGVPSPAPDRAAPPNGVERPPGPPATTPGTAPTVDIRRTGDPANRITLVLLGDGYTADQQELFRRQADQAWHALMEIEPFRSYQGFFNIRRVEVVSPTPGIAEGEPAVRHPGTPLGMHFWCEGTARLLCADEAATARLAGEGEGPQYLIALANSREYGGAGGTGVTTLAGGSPDAGRIIQHEMGHTVGDLGDEYDSAPGDADYPNLSAVDAEEMRRRQLKWWRWLGAETSDGGGTVGTYRSANGTFRPTVDSVMRTLGGSYNPPSREAIVKQLYQRISPADRPEPTPGAITGRPRLLVRPVPLTGDRQLVVEWRVDGLPVTSPAPDGSWLETTALAVPAGRTVTVSATVRDDTDWVRDEAFREQRMTRTVSWTLKG